MKLFVFDTETISLNKSFIYNLGYCIVESETGEILVQRDFVIKQVYENKPLFATAYYANKRPLYTSKMKGKKCRKVNWGDACRIMLKDIKENGIKKVFAYNSDFDEKAFYFNHLFFKNKRRPLDYVVVNDIMDYIKPLIKTKEYKDFCKSNNYLTGSNRVKQTAEIVYRFIKNDNGFIEEHTALNDSLIESEILLYCMKNYGVNQ